MGYMSLGLLAANKAGYAASSFYVLVYAIMAVGAFGMIVLLSRTGFEAEKIRDFRGLNSRDPWLAFMMLLLMFSMAGIPPMVGFFAKVLVSRSFNKSSPRLVSCCCISFCCDWFILLFIRSKSDVF